MGISIISIAGCSSVGKTEFTKALWKELKKADINALILKQDDFMNPLEIIPENLQFCASGTMVRVAMAKGEAWEHLVPDSAVDYIKKHDLTNRFCKEFGLETIAFFGLGDILPNSACGFYSNNSKEGSSENAKPCKVFENSLDGVR